MREPDVHFETTLAIDFEDATKNLSENLHLKWNYGLLFLDQYTDEQGASVSVVEGLRKQDETTIYIRVQVSQVDKSTYAKFDLWEVITSGWPFPSGMMTIGKDKADKMIDLIDEVREFCTTPYQETTGVMPMIRNMFSGTSETRKYK